MKLKCTFLLFLLVSLALAEQATTLGDFAGGIFDDLKKEADDFRQFAMTAAGSKTGFTHAIEAFQPGYCGDEWRASGPDMVLGPWIRPTLIVLLTLVFVIGILYLAGQLFQSPKLLAFAKEEAFQITMIIVFLAFMLGLLAGANAWYGFRAGWSGANLPDGSIDPLYKNNPTHIDASMAISRYFIGEMVSDYGMLVLYNMLIHTLYSSTLWFGVTWRAMYSFNLGPVLKPIIDIIGIAMQFLGLAISEWMLHLITLCMIKRWAWGLFIPLGMFLRALPQTRGAGAALLALFFMLTLFYPFMFIITYEVHKVMQYNISSGTGLMKSFIGQSGLFGVSGLVLTLAFVFAGVFIPVFLGTGLSVAFQLIKNAVYYIMIIGMLMPFLSIFVTLTAAKETAKAFGVDVSFLSFMKII